MTRSKNSSLLILAGLLLTTALVYANGLNNPFVIDDRVIIFSNFRSGQTWTLGDMFQRGLFGTAPSESPYFRPLTLLTFALNHQLAGEKPQGYRFVNIAVHMLVVGLVFSFLCCVADKWLATFSALLFALHPANVQAVSYISSRSDPLYTALALLCLLFWHKGNKASGRRKSLYLLLALSAFFLGLLAKEFMIVVPLLAASMDLVWNRSGPWHKIRENLVWYLGFLLLFSVYLFVRIGAGFSLAMEDNLELTWESRLLVVPKLFTLYLGLAFYPVHLFLFRAVQVPQSFFEWQVILGVLFLAGIALLAWSLRRTHQEIAFGIVWYLISLLPALSLTLLNAAMMEHWLYLPLIGLTLAFVSGVKIVAAKVGEVRGGALGLTLLALLLSAKTITRNAEWSDLVKVFSRNVSVSPGDYLAWFWLGRSLKDRGMLNDAISAFKTGLAINPNVGRAWIDLGESLSLTRKDQEAEAAFSRAIAIRPEDPMIYQMLGVHRLKMGRNRAAIDAMLKSIHLMPSAGAYHVLGSAYLRLGQNEKAEQAFQKAIALSPKEQSFHAETHINLGKLYRLEGKLKEAQEEWQLALRFEPNHKAALRLLDLRHDPQWSQKE